MDLTNRFFTILLTWCVQHRKVVVWLFYLFFAGLGLLVILSTYIIATQSEFMSFVVRAGKFAGELSAFAFFATTYPGILGRFRLRHPLITLGMSFRRMMGISSFLLALTHASILFIVPGLLTHSLLKAVPLFVVFGAVALFILFPLFLTSNNVSVKTLGPWWKRLHRLVYLIYWLMFLHVIFQGVSTFGILIGISATLEVVSLVYDFFKKRETPTQDQSVSSA